MTSTGALVFVRRDDDADDDDDDDDDDDGDDGDGAADADDDGALLCTELVVVDPESVDPPRRFPVFHWLTVVIGTPCFFAVSVTPSVATSASTAMRSSSVYLRLRRGCPD